MAYIETKDGYEEVEIIGKKTEEKYLGNGYWVYYLVKFKNGDIKSLRRSEIYI